MQKDNLPNQIFQINNDYFEHLEQLNEIQKEINQEEANLEQMKKDSNKIQVNNIISHTRSEFLEQNNATKNQSIKDYLFDSDEYNVNLIDWKHENKNQIKLNFNNDIKLIHEEDKNNQGFEIEKNNYNILNSSIKDNFNTLLDNSNSKILQLYLSYIH